MKGDKRELPGHDREGRTEYEPGSNNPTNNVTGITSFWLFNVEVFTGTGEGAELVSLGAGDLHVTEVSTGGVIIRGNFHPGDGGRGYGEVTRPYITYATEGHLHHPRYWLITPGRNEEEGAKAAGSK